jgi:ABC-type branched-subunit amino acid transport system substrate-binding protein
MHKARLCVATGAAIALLATACSSTKTSGGSGAIGPGVTHDTISLGYLTDLSGPASGAGKIDYHGSQLYIDQLNKNGGVCGRQIKLTVQDDQYDPQKALSLYQQTEPKVLGFLSTLGTPVLSALSSRFRQDQVLTTTLGWDYTNLSNPSFIVAPSTSDMDMVAGLGYFNEKGLLHKGDSVGEIYIQGLGASQMPGVEYAAKQLNLKVQKFEVAPTATDLSSQVQQFKKAGAKAIVVEGLPTQTASAATAASSIGLNVPILTGPAGFVPNLMTTAAAPALQAHLYQALAWSPFSADNPGVKQVRAAFNANKGGVSPSDSIVVSWTLAKIYTDIIGRSCDQLTRTGLMKTARSITDLKATGLVGDMDFSKVGQPAARTYNIVRVDTKTIGAQKLVSPAFITPALVKDYPVPASS